MRISLKIVFWYVSFLLLVSSCSIRHHSGYKKTEPFDVQKQDFIANNFQKVLFKTQIQAFGKDVSGLLFIKLMGADNYRFVFLTQIGMKIFDVELNKGLFTVHQLISYLDKKSVRKLLENDLKLLIQSPNTKQKIKFFTHTKDRSRLIRHKENKAYLYYQYLDKRIFRKENNSFIFKGTIASYYYNDSQIPEKIIIKHSGINLQWELKPIDKKERQ